MSEKLIFKTEISEIKKVREFFVKNASKELKISDFFKLLFSICDESARSADINERMSRKVVYRLFKRNSYYRTYP